jgi:hypothetical protein
LRVFERLFGDGGELAGDIAGRRVALRRRFAHHALDHRIHVRFTRVARGGRDVGLMQVRLPKGFKRVGVEGWFAGHQNMCCDAQRIDIGSPIDRAIAPLLSTSRRARFSTF